MTIELLVNAGGAVTAWLAAATAVVLLLGGRTAAVRRTACRVALAGVPVILAAAGAMHVLRPSAGLVVCQAGPAAPAVRQQLPADPRGVAWIDQTDTQVAEPDEPTSGRAHEPAGWPDRLPPAVGQAGNLPARGPIGIAAPASAPGNWRLAVLSGVVSISLASLFVLAMRLLRLALWRRTWRQAPPAWLSLTRRLAGRVGLETPFSVYVAEGLAQPAAAGLVRAAIVLPDRSPHDLGPHLRGALAHELGHLKGRDPLWCVLGHIVLALAWWCPPAWYLQRRQRLESEMTADDHALDSGVRPRDLAKTLARFAEWQLGPMPVGVSGMACHLRRRIEMILNAAMPHASRMSRRSRWLLGLGACLVAAAVVSTPLVGVARAADNDELARPPEVRKDAPRGEGGERRVEVRREGERRGDEEKRAEGEARREVRREGGEGGEIRREGEVRREAEVRREGEGKIEWKSEPRREGRTDARTVGMPARDVWAMAEAVKITNAQEKALREQLEAKEQALRAWRQQNEPRIHEATEAIRKAQQALEALRLEEREAAEAADTKVLAVFTPQQRALWATTRIAQKYTQMRGGERGAPPPLTNRQLDDIDILCEKAAKELVEAESKPPAERVRATEETLNHLDRTIYEKILDDAQRNFAPRPRGVMGKFEKGEGGREGGDRPREEGAERRRDPVGEGVDRPREEGGERRREGGEAEGGERRRDPVREGGEGEGRR